MFYNLEVCRMASRQPIVKQGWPAYRCFSSLLADRENACFRTLRRLHIKIIVYFLYHIVKGTYFKFKASLL